jgi:hypothetical protein
MTWKNKMKTTDFSLYNSRIYFTGENAVHLYFFFLQNHPLGRAYLCLLEGDKVVDGGCAIQFCGESIFQQHPLAVLESVHRFQ